MAEYGYNKLTSELAQQYIDEMNGVSWEGNTGKHRDADSRCWWPAIKGIPHPEAGESVPEDAEVPDPQYNIYARWDLRLDKWVIAKR